MIDSELPSCHHVNNNKLFPIIEEGLSKAFERISTRIPLGALLSKPFR